MATLEIEVNGIFYNINDNDYSEELIYSQNNDETVFIPKSIKYQSSKYLVTSISFNSFNNYHNVKIVSFSYLSGFMSFHSFAFNSL